LRQTRRFTPAQLKADERREVAGTGRRASFRLQTAFYSQAAALLLLLGTTVMLLMMMMMMVTQRSRVESATGGVFCET